MPIYEYQCETCSDRFEELVMSSDTNITCPRCGSEKVSKRLSAFFASAGNSGSSVPSCYRPGCESSGFG